MLKHEWAALRDMTLETSIVLPEQQRPATFDLLRKACSAALDRATNVRVVTIGAGHFAFHHRMVMRQFKLCPHFKVALETCFGRSTRIDDLALIASGGNVKTSRTVARFATHLLGVIAGRFQAGVDRRPKVARNIFVTSLARLRADKLSAGNTRRREN